MLNTAPKSSGPLSRMTDMTPSVFIAADALDTLQRYRLDSFEALWSVQAEPVDEPNNSRGGHSSVSRLTLKDANDNPQVFYLKRQSNYLIRTVRRPLGEPTAARELYNIERYARLGIPALQAAFFSQRQIKGKWQAVLLTQDLEGYLPLNHWLTQWHILSYCQKRDLLEAAAKLVALLHARSIVHNCLYPKHIFLKPTEDGTGARLIDLEKSRAHLFSPRGRMRDLETLHRRSQPPSRSQRLRFLLSYLGKSKVDAQVRYWVTRLLRRSALKSAKHDKCTVQKFCG